MYFQPFYHEKTRHHYVDGALTRNNPVGVANRERRLIWPNQKRLPDIVLSLGTGLQIQGPGTRPVRSSGKMAFLRKILPPGVAKRVSLGRDVIASTLDCENQWNDFLDTTRGDRKFRARCHRLNVGLESCPPKLDDVGSIPTLKKQAREYLHPRRETDRIYLNSPYENAHDHIMAVARRLLAALFYFDEDSETGPESSPGTSSNHPVTGVLGCRLSPSMESQAHSLLRSNLHFQVRNGYQSAKLEHRKPFPHFHAQTYLSDVQFPRSQDRSREVIEVYFSDKGGKWEPISGY
jgi:hypothetical protein